MSKRWVIPDSHGCIKTLRALIEYRVIPSKQDQLYFLGDYIDRGPDSKGIIDYLIMLKEEGYNMYCLKGNHEENLVKVYEWEQENKGFWTRFKRNIYLSQWMQFGGMATMNSFGIKDLKDFPPDYIEWLDKLDYYYEVDDYLLIHAGLNFEIDNPLDDKYAMLWKREFKIIPEKINHKKIIHGHVPISLDFIKHQIEKEDSLYIDLDNGVYVKDTEGMGNLCAFELGSKQLLVQGNIDF